MGVLVNGTVFCMEIVTISDLGIVDWTSSTLSSYDWNEGKLGKHHSSTGKDLYGWMKIVQFCSALIWYLNLIMTHHLIKKNIGLVLQNVQKYFSILL